MLRRLLGYPQEQIEALTAAGAFGSTANAQAPYRRAMTLHEGKSVLTEEIKALVGAMAAITYEVDRTGIRAWARAVGYDDPVYYDESVALARGYPRLPAPPGFLGVPRFRPGEPEPGPPIRGLHPELQRSVNGGTELEYHATVFAGDELVATPVIVDIKERQGFSWPDAHFDPRSAVHEAK